MSKSRKDSLTTFITLGTVALVFLVCKLAADNGWGWMTSTLRGQLIPICAWIIMAVSLNLVVGISGELSLGHAGFMSLGAFTSVMMTNWMQRGLKMDNDLLVFCISTLIAAAASGVIGLLIGFTLLRLRGDYLAIVTLAFGQIISNILQLLYFGVNESTGAMGMALNLGVTPKLKSLGFTELIKGAQGAVKIPRIASFEIGSVLVLLTLILVFNLINSRSGRAIRAIRDNRIAAESMGLQVKKYKIMAFVTASVLAGVAGSLYGLSQPTMKAGFFEYNKSIEVLVFVVLGGIGNIWGSIISATALTILPEVLRGFSEYRMLIYAIVLILVMIFTNNVVIRRAISSVLHGLGIGRGKSEKPDQEVHAS